MLLRVPFADAACLVCLLPANQRASLCARRVKSCPQKGHRQVSGLPRADIRLHVHAFKSSNPPQVFSGEVDESVRHEQQLLEGEIMRMLKLLDMSINHQVGMVARVTACCAARLQPGKHCHTELMCPYPTA